MTNFERYLELTSGLDAPTVMLKAGWLSCVSSALERRVFFGDVNRPLHANQYTLLVGPAGVGKGLVLSEVKRLLSKHYLYSPEEMKKPAKDRKPYIDPETHLPRHQFYCLPDATTFEQVVVEMASIKTAYQVENDQIVTACPAYFCLEELASLLRPKKSEDVARWLLSMYDNKPYSYKTISRGNCLIEQGCLNLIAGTTPDFFEDAEKHKMMGEGLMSRFLMVCCESTDRKQHFHIPDLTKEQLEHQTHLQKWLAFLGHIYGKVSYVDPGTFSYLEAWWEKEVVRLRMLQDDRLEKAFARRKVQVIKLAMAMHFSESTDMALDVSCFDEAIRFAHSLEDDAVNLLRSTGDNKTYSLQRRLLNRLRMRSPQQMGELTMLLAPHLDFASITSVFEMCKQAGEILVEGDLIFAVDPITRQRVINDPAYQPKDEVLMPPKR